MRKLIKFLNCDLPGFFLSVFLLVLCCGTSSHAQPSELNEPVVDLRSSPRVVVRTLLNPTFYDDLGISERYKNRKGWHDFINVAVDVRLGNRIGVSLAHYSYSYDSGPVELTNCITGLTTKIWSLMAYRDFCLGRRFSLIPAFGISHTEDVLGGGTFTIGVCTRPSNGGRSLGMIAKVELRYDLWQGVNAGCVVFANNAINNNIRHLGIGPSVSISF